jgi:membrane-bound serine protease (ClpP class)
MEKYPMPWYKIILRLLFNPIIRFLLLIVAILGIIFEIQTPGATLPGVLGSICFILFLYSLSVIPVNYAGLLLIALAIGLFIADIKVPSHGVLSVGGILAFFFGSMMVFGTGEPGMAAPIAVIIAGTLATALFFIFLVGIGAKALKNPVVSGREGIIGKVVTARTDIAPVCKIFTEGSWWNAETDDEPIKAGERVKITGIEGLTIKVTKVVDTEKEEH